MNVKEVIDAQYRVLAMVDQLELNRDSIEFKAFKHRIFKNIEYLMKITQ